ncbi:histidine phosphatase family protein [Micromonospora sp. NBC_01796]|uniref:histidine phosphatase family protein n=1 Tax=Micromonospora sp. NBC_01796 TaxID=2975987 RepID=UPI002DD90862|nr:histidine phosphatase family protein [Micromonospora sp. NBC_01796]WSA85451.1 histidine phosphatase family protein [Micromonospora sp. NBC_01796]
MANRFLHLARHGEAIDEGRLTEAGQQQARLLGRRLANVPLTAIHHSPLPRAVHTAELIGESLPDVPLCAEDVLGDYIPPVPDPDALPEVYTRFLDGVTPTEYTDGARLAAAAIERYALPAVSEPAGSDTHELIVTHNFLIGWFIRHALDAPDHRWLGLNQSNCALTTILYRPDRPPALVRFNDMSHLPAELRWTGFPSDLNI